MELIDECLALGMADVLLPPFADARSLARLAALLTPVRVGRTLKTLVADDSSTIRTLLVGLLQDMGFAVTQAEDGELGLRAVRADRPDVITTDYDMPNLDGWGLCRHSPTRTSATSPS